MKARRFAGRVRFEHDNGETTSWPDPCSEQVANAAYLARYDRVALSQTDCFHLASCAETMAQILNDDYPMIWVAKKIRALRKAIREVECEPAQPPAAQDQLGGAK